jgi:hypothetical protein
MKNNIEPPKNGAKERLEVLGEQSTLNLRNISHCTIINITTFIIYMVKIKFATSRFPFPRYLSHSSMVGFQCTMQVTMNGCLLALVLVEVQSYVQLPL